MAKVLLIEGDPKVTLQISEALRDRFEVEAFSKADDFISAALQSPACLSIIDFDIKETDGIQIYKKLKEKNPQAKSIMISSSNNIPLAVNAAKLGVLEFFRKPLILADFVSAVEKLSKEENIKSFTLEGVENIEWLAGKSARLIEFKKSILRIGKQNKDVILFAERGINQKTVIRLIHLNSARPFKKLVNLGLSSFSNESSEGHFWATINELLSFSSSVEGVKKLEEIPGLVFIDGFEAIPEHFRLSILDFLKKRKGKASNEVKIILGVQRELGGFEEFERIIAPPLRERKEDLPAIIAEYIKNKMNCSSISSEILEMISDYDFLGNYDELENMIKASCLDGNTLSRLNINKKALLSEFKTLIDSSALGNVRGKFDKKMIKLALNLTQNNIHLAARFLGLPKTALEERIRVLDI